MTAPMHRVSRLPGRLDVTRAWARGRLAGLAGKDVHAMPYDVTSTDLAEKVRVNAWLRGWRLHQKA